MTLTVIKKHRFKAVVLLSALVFAATAAYASLPDAKNTIARPEVLKLDDISDKDKSFMARMIEKLGHNKRLSPEDSARYANIFAFQDNGDFTKATREIKKLKDKRLVGHVLYQRYMHADYKASYAELSDWMKLYADHPGAQNVYDLAQSRKKNKEALTSPHMAKGVIGQHDFDIGRIANPAVDKDEGRVRVLIREIDSLLASDKPSVALQRLNGKEGKKAFKNTEYDYLQANIASSYFYNAKFDKAFDLASASADRSGGDVPIAGWIAGLSAWKKGQYSTAATYFEKASQSERASGWMSSAAAYWAARAYIRADKAGKVEALLEKAAEHPRTFYGLIALKALGEERDNFNWNLPQLRERHIAALSDIPAGRRAIALVDADQPEMAEAELSQINPGKNKILQEALVALTSHNGMPGMAMRVGSTFKANSGDMYDAALYPDAPWSPEKGFEVDRALVYAFIRQESQFNIHASNRGSGAKGLMQIMPNTAKHVAGDTPDVARLHDPQVNIDLGQRYLAELLKNKSVDGNLFKLAVAYNAGPGKLARFQGAAHHIALDDPLFFIESFPLSETRMFVERVLTNYWIYRIKYKQSTESLDAVAEGEWPQYLAQDNIFTRRFADAVTRFAQ